MSARRRALAREAGFTQISASHEVSPLVKFVGRGDTAVVDAYLSPLLRRYVDRVATALLPSPAPGRSRAAVRGGVTARRPSPGRLRRTGLSHQGEAGILGCCSCSRRAD